MANDFLSNLLPTDNAPPPPMGQVPTQMPPQYQHINDVLSTYMNNQQQNQPNGMLQQLLSNRMQPTMGDAATAGLREAQSYASPQGFKPYSPEGIMAERTANELAPYTSLLENQMKAGTQYMNMSGGGTGVLANRWMQDNPGHSFTEALNHVQADPRLLGMGLQLQPGMGNQPTITSIPGAPSAMSQVEQGKQSGQEAAKLQYAGPIAAQTMGAQEGQKQAYAGPIAQATEMGKNAAENFQQGKSMNDIVGLYGKLQTDAKAAPSGTVQSDIARAANYLNIPTKGSVAQATFDADLNNLYLATIRSLKGTGRVMEQELNKIAESAPKSTDSMEVKQAKAQAHMQYYQQRMQSLGFDPATGQPAGGNGIPNPPTPDQIQQQMQGMQGQGGATHRYNPATGQLEEVQ